MNRYLLSDRRFWPIFWTQFLGAFNDNVLRNAMVILITMKSLTFAGISASQMVALCGGIFILPFFLSSATAGQLADKYSKSKLVFWVKVWGILLMLLGAYGFLIENLSILLIALFMTGLQSTFFGPVKYSILPHLLREDELASGTAYVEMGTFLSILMGTISWGVLIAIPDSGPWLAGMVMVALAPLGCLTSTMIKPLAPVTPELELQVNPISPTWEILKLTAKTRSIFLSILGTSWFWFLGAALLSLLLHYCKEFLNGEESVITLACSMEAPEIMELAFERIAEELRDGQLVCYFPEGRLTRDGTMRKFRPGIEWIVQTTPVPVVPMALSGLWGSFFSRRYGKPMSKPFRRFWSRISLVVGKPVPPDEVSARRLYQVISQLQGE